MSDSMDVVLLIGAIVVAVFCAPLLDPLHKQVKLWFHDDRKEDFTD